MTPVREALEPCPFCGGHDVVCCDQGDDDFAVTCKSCGATSAFNDDEAKVRALWNTRASAAPGEPCAWVGTFPDGQIKATTDRGKADYWKSLGVTIEPSYRSPQPAAGWDEAIRSAMDAIEKMRVAGACNFTDARHQGQRGVDYTDTLYDAYQAVKALRREAPAPAEGVTPAELIAALRTFPHFEGDTPVTPDAICAVAKEYVDMVMTWEPQRAALEFLDHEGNKHWLVYEAGDGDLAGSWTLRDDSNLATRPDTAEARLREVLEREERYLQSHFNHEVGGIMPSDIEGAFHRLRQSISTPSGGDEAKESEGGQEHHGRSAELIDRVATPADADPKHWSSRKDPVRVDRLAPSEPSPPADRREISDDWIMNVVRYSTVGSKAVPKSEWCAFARAIIAALDGGRDA